MSSAGSSKATKEDISSPPRTTDTASPPEECVRREDQTLINNKLQGNINQEPIQLSLSFAKTIRGKMETKGYNPLEKPLSFLKPIKDKRHEEDRLVLADNRNSLSKALFITNLYLPTTSPFQSVNTTQERIAHFQNKIYKEAQKCALELENISVLSQQRMKSVTESAQCKKADNRSFNNDLKLSAKRLTPEFNGSPLKDQSVEDKESFQCSYCEEVFATGQALGGHMSRKHTGKSLKYNHKKDVRRQREFERMKLYLAKKKYFQELGYDYDVMMQTPDGKMKAKTYMNRSRIKKIKTLLSVEEIMD